MSEDNLVSPRSAFLRRTGPVDGLLSEIGRALQVLSGASHASRPNPAGPLDGGGPLLSSSEQRHAAGLMRVNHVGEVCAQALYRGQAAVCRDPRIQALLRQASTEEVDHLAWCRTRLQELHSRPSYLNPLWYAGSFSLGALAGSAGTAKSLGFMAETESQVEHHLNRHLDRLPENDERSRRIVEQMRDDEIRHRMTAERNGAHALPRPVKWTMRAMAKLMTTSAYWV